MLRVLLVDDEPQVLDLLEACMAAEGHETMRATDGRMAVGMARTLRPDLIVMDSRMPTMDGLEAARQLRADVETSSIPVLMLTALSSDSDVWDGYQAGVASYMTKPLDPELLNAEIRRLLTWDEMSAIA